MHTQKLSYYPHTITITTADGEQDTISGGSELMALSALVHHLISEGLVRDTQHAAGVVNVLFDEREIKFGGITFTLKKVGD